MTQNDLFDQAIAKENNIPDLIYFPEFITEEQESNLIETIESQEWLNDLKRRVQHYGFKYDYTARNIDNSMKIGDIPSWLEEYSNLLFQKKLLPKIADQVIINEYQPGQGISSHIDCIPCFEESIACISLGSKVCMEFIHSKTNEIHNIILNPRSVFILTGDARYIWKHGIRSRKTDMIDGVKISRNRRMSITFRNVILND